MDFAPFCSWWACLHALNDSYWAALCIKAWKWDWSSLSTSLYSFLLCTRMLYDTWSVVQGPLLMATWQGVPNKGWGIMFGDDEQMGELTHVIHLEEINSLVKTVTHAESSDDMLACYPRFRAIVRRQNPLLKTFWNITPAHQKIAVHGLILTYVRESQVCWSRYEGQAVRIR